MIAEFALVATLSLANSPFDQNYNPKNVKPFYPSSLIRFEENNFYIEQISSASCLPRSLNRWGPKTALWSVEAGYKNGIFQVGIGHLSEHGIDRVIPWTESRDYISFKIRKEFN